MHLYEEDLKKMVEIRKETLGEEERAVKARMKEKAAKAKAAKK